MKKKIKVIIILSIVIIIFIFICFVPLIWERHSRSESSVTYDSNEFGKIVPEEGWDDYQNNCYDCRVVIEGRHATGVMRFSIYYLTGGKEQLVKSFDVEITDYFKEIIMIPHISEKKGMIHDVEEYTVDAKNSFSVIVEKRYTILQYIKKEINYFIEDIKDRINRKGNKNEKNTL